MSDARENYAKLHANTSGPHHQGQTSGEAQAALDEIDRLREQLDYQNSLPTSMYLEAQKRYMALTDAVFEKLSHGDVHGVIQFAMEMADGCDYVDEEMAEVATRAAQRFPPDYIFGAYPEGSAGVDQ